MDFLDALFDKNSLNENGDLTFNPFEKAQEISKIDVQGVYLNFGENISDKEHFPKFFPGNIPLETIPKRIEKLSRLNDTSRKTLNDIEAILAIGIQATQNMADSKKSNMVFIEALKKLKELKKRKVLFIGAENKDKSKINIEKEYDFLKELAQEGRIGLQRAKPASLERIFSVWDDYRPSIVFFSCHGQKTSLFLEDNDGNTREVTAIELKKFFFERSEYTECVILSACSSSKIGKELKDSCKNIVATTEDISIKTARKFTNTFFDYIERNEDALSVIYENAFRESTSLIQSLGLPNSYSFEFYKSDKKM